MSGFSLYQITGEYLSALDALTADDDIPPEAIADTLEGLAGAWEEKALNVARYIRNLEAEANAITFARTAMEARERAATAKARRLKEYLRGELDRTGLKPKSADIAIRTHRNPAIVVITDESLIPDDYRQERVTYSISKTDIKAALQAGAAVNGARLEQTTRLVIQ